MAVCEELKVLFNLKLVRSTMNITLNNGVVMPTIGLGVFQSAPEETTAAVETALAAGYRHIDTAAAYGNEWEVGDGIRRSDLDRAEVFIETKVWVSDYGYEQTLHAWDKATGKLHVDYLDLFILHQPAPDRFGKTIAAYKALETLLADGRVRAIGVSNIQIVTHQGHAKGRVQILDKHRAGFGHAVVVGIAAAKLDLEDLSQQQKFRSDLYYRLNLIVLHLPPLRERREDIPMTGCTRPSPGGNPS